MLLRVKWSSEVPAVKPEFKIFTSGAMLDSNKKHAYLRVFCDGQIEAGISPT